MLIVGIDIAKETFTAGLWDEKKGQFLGEYVNDATGYKTLHECLAEQNEAATALKLIMDPDVLATRQKRLLTIPGVEPVLVKHLLLLLSHWQQRTQGRGTTKQLVAFVGLDPQPFESGKSVYKRSTISKMGDKIVR